MKPVSRVNPATDEEKNTERNSTSNEMFDSKSSSGTNVPEGCDDSKVTDLGHRAQELATRFAGKAQEFSGKAMEQTGSFVKNHPGPTLLAGFGAGILVGVAIARR